MIELRHLTKSYLLNNGERRYVFRDLNFRFPEDANIGLIGRNGAGKSTLLRLIGGIDVPDSGQVICDQRISWPVGLSGGFQGMLTGRDSVKFVCRIYGAEGDAMREKIRFVQEFAEIGDYFEQPVNSYSSGMRSRLGFGMSMAFDFDYYLIDEVMAVGDAQFKAKSRALLRDKLGMARVIMVSHNMEDISRLCNMVVLVQDGQAVLYENVREGIRAYQATGGTILRPRQPQGPRQAMRRNGEPGKPRGLAGTGPKGQAKRQGAPLSKVNGDGRGGLMQPGPSMGTKKRLPRENDTGPWNESVNGPKRRLPASIPPSSPLGREQMAPPLQGEDRGEGPASAPAMGQTEEKSR